MSLTTPPPPPGPHHRREGDQPEDAWFPTRTRGNAIGHGLGLVGLWTGLLVAIAGIGAAIASMVASQGCRSECYGYGLVAYVMLGGAAVGAAMALGSWLLIRSCRPVRRLPSPWVQPVQSRG